MKIKGVTSGKPCSLSRKFIIKYLRKKYHYRGLIISDDLKMRAIKNWYGYKKAVIDAIHAGNDIVIFRYNQKQEEKTILNLMDKVKSGKLNNYRINQSVKRILKIKEKYQLDDSAYTEDLDVQSINKRIAKIREILT